MPPYVLQRAEGSRSVIVTLKFTAGKGKMKWQ